MRAYDAHAELPIAARVAADETDVGESARERDDVHRRGFPGQIVAAGEARLAADLEPRVDVDRRVELGGEADDRVVVGVAARDAGFVTADIFDADARAVPYPLFHLSAAFVGESRINRRDARETIPVALEDGAECVVEGRGREGVGERAADLEGDGAFDAHAFDVEIIGTVLRDGVGRRAVEAVEVRVPDAEINEFVAGGQAVVGGVEVEFARGHRWAWVRSRRDRRGGDGMEASQIAEAIELSFPTRAPEKILAFGTRSLIGCRQLPNPARSVVGSSPESRGTSFEPNLEPH